MALEQLKCVHFDSGSHDGDANLFRLSKFNGGCCLLPFAGTDRSPAPACPVAAVCVPDPSCPQVDPAARFALSQLSLLCSEATSVEPFLQGVH